MYEDLEKEIDRQSKAKHPSTEQLMIRMALDELTDKQKAIWNMYAYDRLTQEEIADVLGIRDKAVENQIAAIQNKIIKFVHNNKAAYVLLKLEHKIMNEETE